MIGAGLAWPVGEPYDSHLPPRSAVIGSAAQA